MGVAADLSYSFRRPNPFQRLVQKFASTPVGAWCLARSLPRLDSLVQRLSKGRHTVPSLFAGLPVIDVTTTGRKSGMRRTTHLISIPLGDTLALLGTNFGQKSTPAWVFNLEADPRATVDYRGSTVDVVARPATEAEETEVMANAAGIYDGYRKYRHRVSGRRVRIFVLDPAA